MGREEAAGALRVTPAAAGTAGAQLHAREGEAQSRGLLGKRESLGAQRREQGARGAGNRCSRPRSGDFLGRRQ
ncbi:hypothetical protein Nmel_000365 [Mimus melanotis]